MTHTAAADMGKCEGKKKHFDAKQLAQFCGADFLYYFTCSSQNFEELFAPLRPTTISLVKEWRPDLTVHF